MTNITVKFLSMETNIPIDRLVKKFADAGIKKTEIDVVTQKEKEILLAYLDKHRGTINNKLTIQRRTRSVLNISSVNGKKKSIHVEVRKQHTYVKYDSLVKNSEIISKIQDICSDKILQNEIVASLGVEKVNRESHSDTEDSHKHFKELLKNNNELVQNIDMDDNSDDQINKKSKQDAKEQNECKFQRKFNQNIKKRDITTLTSEENINFSGKNCPFEEDFSDYSVMLSQQIQENDSNLKVEINRRNRRIGKTIRQKKSNRSSGAKFDNECKSIEKHSKINKSKLNILKQSFNKPERTISRDIVIGETITVAELANKMAIKGSQVIKLMMKLGAMVTINQVIDQETAQLIAEEMGHKVVLRRANEVEESIISDRDARKSPSIELRAPVVTIMGHVDHGKTSLLDYIRRSKLTKEEAGGITQKIGAYHVDTDSGSITFLDTPGHMAFTAMRARGVKITDIVVLVIAADDGIMPQTVEAIKHAKESDVPIIVAINKIDKSEVHPDRIKSELIQYGILSEELGGENQFVNVSAKSGKGIDELLSAILLQAEILELKAVRDIMASGVVIDSFLDKGKGPVATVLVREGTLKQGDIVLCGSEYGKIRAMRDEKGRNISFAGPSIPVEILGLSGIPISGDEVMVVKDEKKAREVALYRQGKFREIRLAKQRKFKENALIDLSNSATSELRIILKSHTQGSVEAIVNTLNNLSANDTRVKIISYGVGSITETDSILAIASKAILVGFNVRADVSARRIIESENLDVYYYAVIYDLIGEIKEMLNGMSPVNYQQNVIGLAEVRNIFRSPKFGIIAGCMVINGIVKRYSKIRILRDSIAIYNGELSSLRRFKDDVNEVKNGIECGIGVKNYSDIRRNDLIEVFQDSIVV